MEIKKCLWLHDYNLHPDQQMLRENPDQPILFIFDEPRLRREPIAFHRLRFIHEGVSELFASLANPIKEIRCGNPVEELLSFCTNYGCQEIVVQDHPDPHLRSTIAQIGAIATVAILPRDSLVYYDEIPRRFSRYWEKSARDILGYYPKAGKHKRHR